jgi:hypothetical protein
MKTNNDNTPTNKRRNYEELFNKNKLIEFVPNLESK